MQFCRDHEPFFRRWAEIWFQNFQFIYGNHNIKWSKRYGFAVDYDFLRKGSPFEMRCQTNIARTIAESLAALIYSNLPTWETEAMDASSIRGKRFQKIVQKLLDCYMERLSMDKDLATAALIYTISGQFAAKIDWSMKGGKLLEVPRYRKTKAPMMTTYMAPNPFTGGLFETPTPALDSMGQPMSEDRWEAVLDQMGRQIIDRFFAGDAGMRILTPFEYRRQLGSQGMHKTRWVQEFRLLDYDEYMDEYEDVGGKTKEWNQIRPMYNDETIYAFAVRHFMRMQFTVPPTVEDGFRRADSVLKSSLFKHKVFVVEHYDKPHPKKWPMGRRVVVVNGVATHITTPTYCVPGKLDGWHPFVEAQWMPVAPNSISSGPMNDVIRKNRELDVKDSLTGTALRRNMGSQLLIKYGSGIDPQKMTGEPGVAHEVSDPYGVRWLHDEMPIPPVLASLRQMDKDDIYESSGAGDALRGERSVGVSSGYHAKQIEEREEKRLAPARKNFEGAVVGMGEKLWWCIKTNVVRLDDGVMGYLKRAAAGEFTEQDVVAMLSGPMDFGVDIKITKSSMALKSKATQEATMLELVQGPAADRVKMDAKVLDSVLDYFGCDILRDGSSSHRDRAQREDQTYLDMIRLGPDIEGIGRPLVMFEDDDDIHMAEHVDDLVKNADDYLKNRAVLLEKITHIERHRLQKQEKAAQLMPGTSLLAPNFAQAAQQMPPPTVQTVMQHTMMEQQKAAMGQKPQPGQTQAPQAPRGQKTAPGQPGAKPQNPAAPSGNTQTAPSAASKGQVA